MIGLCMLGATVVFAEESSIYPDIEGHFAQHEIEALFETGAINYSKDEALYPDEAISRAQFLFMLITTKGITPLTTYSQTNFDDVSMDDWHYPYIETAYQLGIITGDNGNKSFFPNAEISRQEAVLMLLRSLGEGEIAKKYRASKEEIAKYKDGSDLAKWAKNEVMYAISKNYMNGIEEAGEKYLYPNRMLTKAEAAILVYNTLYQRLLNESLQKEDVDAIPVTYFTKMDVKATAYNSNETGLSNWSRTGLSVRAGLVAVDPRVIPLGTHLYIPGYGFAIAADTGGAIKDAKIDLYMNSLQEALSFGRQDVVVYILDPISQH